jgi:hypothetical protein
VGYVTGVRFALSLKPGSKEPLFEHRSGVQQEDKGPLYYVVVIRNLAFERLRVVVVLG